MLAPFPLLDGALDGQGDLDTHALHVGLDLVWGRGGHEEFQQHSHADSYPSLFSVVN